MYVLCTDIGDMSQVSDYSRILVLPTSEIIVTHSSGGYRGGGQTRPMPPLTNKDTPPVHHNEFNYMSSAPHCLTSCRR